ncbi:MAG: glycerol-3-phosphate 1-O-acyltransferase PlsY [Desulfobacterales bacterium]|nr:MAG: glycerol-3-phosphate 1-O-acyltransferase PlsY [Desulfobacterales bacterium]
MSDPQFPPLIAGIGLTILAYLLGSIPWGVVLTLSFTSVDVRRRGSGNIGATNVSRVAGSTLGLLTFIGDVLKGAVPVYLALIFVGSQPVLHDPLPAVVALAAFFGHLYPLFMKFKKGGKGVATCAGCFVVLAPLACLAALLTFIVSLFLARRVSVGSLAAAAVLPIAVWFSVQSVQITIGAVIMTVFIFIRHTNNIKRLIAGTEPKFRDRSKD